jgi:hypothetical protein
MALFPCFYGTMKCSDLLSPISPRFVSFAWRYHAVRLCSFPQARRRLGAWSFVTGNPEPDSVDTETTGTPKFLGNPNVPTPCSPTPAGSDHRAI